jgi:serine/threonine protein kinase
MLDLSKNDYLIDENFFINLDSTTQKQYVIGRIFFDTCVGLQYMHYNGITHRDVKNDNIVAKSSGKGGSAKAMLIDFNSVTHYDEIDSDITEIIGTMAYAAPEALALDPIRTFEDISNKDEILLEREEDEPLDEFIEER